MTRQNHKDPAASVRQRRLVTDQSGVAAGGISWHNEEPFQDCVDNVYAGG
jgi:hypothetical protein